MTDEADDVELEVISAYVRLTEVREEAAGLAADSLERLCANQDLIPLESAFNRAVENARAGRWAAGEPAPTWREGYDDGFDLDDDVEPATTTILDAADEAVAEARVRVADLEEIEDDAGLAQARLDLMSAVEFADATRRSTKSVDRAESVVKILQDHDEPLAKAALAAAVGVPSEAIHRALKIALDAGVVAEVRVGGRVRYGLASVTVAASVDH